MFSVDTGDYRIELKYKKIKHIYFRVLHDTRQILISAPSDIHPETLEQAVRSKKEWLKKKTNQKFQPAPNLIHNSSGVESLLFFGEKCPIRFHFSGGRRKIKTSSDGFIHIYIKSDDTYQDIEPVIEKWYREKLKILLSEMIAKWQPRIGVKVKEYRVRKMRTRWGSCNVNVSRIWINLALIRMDKDLLEYVLVHEMVHLLEPSHNKRFKQLMSRFLPNWPDLKKRLNYTAVDPPSTINV